MDRSASSIRRIVIVIDASASDLGFLEAAARLAVALQAELLGLYVEDEELLQVAALGFTREIDAYSGVARPFDDRDVIRRLQAQARRARVVLAAVAERSRVPWSFRVTRGIIALEVGRTAGARDLIALGPPRSRLGRLGLGRTAQSILARDAPLMLFLGDAIAQGPILVLFDGGEAARRALATAVQLDRLSAPPLVVLLPAPTEAEAARLRAEAEGLLESRPARFRRIREPSPSQIAHVGLLEGAGLLVLPGDGKADPEALLARLDLPLLVVR